MNDELLDQKFRKNLKKLDMTTLDAVMLLSRSFEMLMRFGFVKYGKHFQKIVSKYLDFDEEKELQLGQYFHVCTYIVLPFLGLDMDDMKDVKDQIVKKLREEEEN